MSFQAIAIFGLLFKMDKLSPMDRFQKWRLILGQKSDPGNKVRISASQLCQDLRDQHIVYDIEGYRKLGKNQLRVSLFHNVSLENLKKLTKLLEFCFEQLLNN